MSLTARAFCSECFDGEIVEDANLEGNYFCNSCYKSAVIEKFNGYRKTRKKA